MLGHLHGRAVMGVKGTRLSFDCWQTLTYTGLSFSRVITLQFLHLGIHLHMLCRSLDEARTG